MTILPSIQQIGSANRVLFNDMGLLTLTNGATYLNGVLTLVGNGTNAAVRGYINQYLYPAYHYHKATFRLVATNAGAFKFGLGSQRDYYGAASLLYNPAIFQWVTMWEGNAVGNIAQQNSGLTITVGDLYIIEMVKSGAFQTTTITHNSQSFSYTNPSHSSGYLGKPTIFCENGTVEVVEWEYGRTNKIPTWAVFGDSFIGDGNDTPNKKWVGHLRDFIGVDNIYISGRGGETSSELLADRFTTELSWISPAYVVISEGTNAENVATYQSNLLNMIAQVEAKGAIPILCTVTRRTDNNNSTFISTVNPWIRSLGKRYVDMNAAVCTDEVNQIASMFHDAAHPNADGYAAMWARFQSDLSDLL